MVEQIVVKSARKHLSIFISYSHFDNAVAIQLRNNLESAGFNVVEYGRDLAFSAKIESFNDKIVRCDFFIFVVSEQSADSRAVQCELGVAVRQSRANRGYLPLIIPIYAPNAGRRADGSRIEFFPYLESADSSFSEAYPLALVRGWDNFQNPSIDSYENLINQLLPKLYISNYNFDDESFFYETGVFDLYNDLFPGREQDNPRDIVRWVLNEDIGAVRDIELCPGRILTYSLDSRYCILSLAGRAVGLGFFTLEKKNNLVFGNYIAIQEHWRAGELAKSFLKAAIAEFQKIYGKFNGFVFEVELFDKYEIERIIQYLERQKEEFPGPNRKKLEFMDEKDSIEIRKFLRVYWYESIGCRFFMDRDSNTPLESRSPCLDPHADNWVEGEDKFWIMWKSNDSISVHVDDYSLWAQSIESIYIEILAKSLLEISTKKIEYWNYVNDIVSSILNSVKPECVCRASYLRRRDEDLFRRWVNLRMPLAI